MSYISYNMLYIIDLQEKATKHFFFTFFFRISIEIILLDYKPTQDYLN